MSTWWDNSMPKTIERVPTHLGTPNMPTGTTSTISHNQKKIFPSNKHHKGCKNTTNFQTTVKSSLLQVQYQKEQYLGQKRWWTVAAPRWQNLGERKYKLLSCYVFSFCSFNWSPQMPKSTPRLNHSALSMQEAQNTFGPPSVPSWKSSLLPQHETNYQKNLWMVLIVFFRYATDVYLSHQL